jgi:uncharacterized delta-60 repeat protein
MNLSRFLHFRVFVPVFVLPLIVALCCACGHPPGTIDPTVTNVTATAATLGGNAADGGANSNGNSQDISSRGVVYAIKAKEAEPAIDHHGVTTVPEGGTGEGVFTVNVTGLQPGTEYAFRAYTNGGGDTGYTEVVTFTTLTPASVSAPTSTGITEDTAILGGTIVANGNPITERGVVLSLKAENDDPRLGGTRVTTFTDAATGDGVFTVPATDLKIGSEYVFRAYVTASGFTSYSESATFSTLSLGTVDGREISAATPHPDGKILVAGSFSALAGEAHDNIARLQAGGSVDAAFTYGYTGFGDLTAVSVQDDGKILVSGFGFLQRIDSSGTVDPTFNPSIAYGNINAVAIQPDGKIVIGGTFLDVNAETRFWLARLNANGTTDTGFNLGDAINSPNNPVNSIVIQPDGKILIAGDFSEVHGITRKGIARLNDDGSLDTTFVPNLGGFPNVQCLLLQPDGKILIGGYNIDFARLNSDGSVDTSFAGRSLSVQTVSLQADGRIIVGGDFTSVNGQPRDGVARFDATGALDPSFAPGFGYFVNSLSLLADGTLLIGGADSPAGPGKSLLAFADAGDAVQELSVPSQSRVVWKRGGSAPEATRVTFDLSTDGGTTWTPLGVGSKIATGWELTGLSLPSNGMVRARGRVPSGWYNGSSGLIEQVVPYPFPIVTNPTLTGLTATGATVGGTVEVGFGVAITERGIVFAKTEENADPQIGGADVTKLVSPGGFGTFTVNLTGLDLTTDYTFKAYATNVNGTTYSSKATFSTPSNPLVTERTAVVTGDTTATLGGNVTSDGGSPITERGVVFARTADNGDPLLGGTNVIKKVEGQTTQGVFTLAVTDLAQGATYSYKAYATSAAGTGYTTVGTFTTFGAPTVILPTVTAITDTSATLGGTVQLDGGSAITMRGVGYLKTADIEADRLISDQDKATRIPVAGTTGSFTTAVSGLTPGTAYTFVAFATNAYGTTTTTPLGTFTTTGAAPSSPEPSALPGSFSGEGASGSPDLPLAAEVDAGFDAGIQPDRYVQAIAVQADGKLVIGGDFGEVDGAPHSMIARVNPDSSLDAAFSPQIDGAVNSIVIQPDGKILAGGLFSSVDDQTRYNIARLEADGTLESVNTFAPGAGADATVYGIALQADGKILIGGLFETVQGVARKGIARLQANGILDTTFDPGTGTDASVFSIAVQLDGKILIGGAFQDVDGTARQRIARLTETGAVDTTFNPGAAANDLVTGVALQPDGKVLVSGYFSGGITRLTSTGAPDPAFTPGSGANDRVYTTAIQTDGKILIGGIFTGHNGTPINRIARLSVNGALDATFDPGSGADDEVDAVALAEDGSLYLGGLFQNVDGTAISGLARLDNDAATETLTVVDGTALTWQRDGARPEIPQADFEISTDGGTTWTDLGAGARVAGGWEIAGLDLPVNGLVRSSGRTSGGFLGGSAGVVEESATFNHQGLISSLQSQLAAANANVAKLTKQIKAAKKKKNKAKAKKLTKSLKTAMALIPKINADLAKYP